MVSDGTSFVSVAALPPNQWQLEVEHFFQTALTGSQTTLLGWVAKPWMAAYSYDDDNDIIGPKDVSINTTMLTLAYVNADQAAQQQTLCRNQLVRSAAAVQNFSVLATSLVVALAVLIILVGTFQPALVGWMRRRSGGVWERAWEGDHQFQVLKVALGAAGVHQWRRAPERILITSERVVVSGSCGDDFDRGRVPESKLHEAKVCTVCRASIRR